MSTLINSKVHRNLSFTAHYQSFKNLRCIFRIQAFGAVIAVISEITKISFSQIVLKDIFVTVKICD